jgi:hypothetical protein
MNQVEIARFVEEVGVMLELEAGTPRMVGRILGWLLICDPPEQSAGDLAQALHASKGSISTATRVLLRLGFIVRVRFPGERFDRFRAQPEAWEEFFWRADQFGGARRIFRIGLDLLGDEPSERRTRLQEIDDLYAWWEQRLPVLREEYLADKRRGRKSGGKGRKR